MTALYWYVPLVEFPCAGEAVSFDMYKGKVVLVTNVACYCGLTNSNYKVGGTASCQHTASCHAHCLMPCTVLDASTLPHAT
jgi:glutathione peroxidase-family protein